MSAPVAPAPLPTRRDWQAVNAGANKTRTRTDIQALRALSVLLVVGYHLWPGAITGGFVGVDVFFVISGFLITGHLAKEADRDGRISLLTFWTRRAFRLLPAALLVIVLTTLAMLRWAPESLWSSGLKQALGSTFYVQNWVLSSTATDYLSSTDPPTAFQHFWSLSVEEQFYLVLPVLLVAVLAVSSKRTWRARFVVVVGAITLASLIWSIYLTATNSAAAYFVSTTRVWEFGLGALLALLGHGRLHKVPPATAWVGLAAILGAGWQFDAATAFPGYAAALPTVGGVLALATVRHDRVWNALADCRPVQMIGDASYSIYLWHWPILVVTPWVVGHPLGFLPRAAILVGSIGVGWLSLKAVEGPLRPRGTVSWQSRSGLVVVSGVIAALALGSSGLGLVRHDAAQSKQRVTAALATADPCTGAPALGRDGCSAPARLTPSLVALSTDDGNRAACWSSQGDRALRSCTLGRAAGAKLHVFAVGDSHNNSLIPAYAKAADQLGWRIDVAGKAGCYLTTYEVPVVDRDRAACRSWRSGMLDKIASDPSIDVVVVTRNEAPDSSRNEAERAAIERGLRDTWSRLTRAGKQVIAVQDVPQVKQSTLDCVARYEADAAKSCAVEQSEVYPGYEAQAVVARTMSQVRLVRVEDSFCRAGWCPPVIGGVPVFLNPGHVSKTFATTWGPQLADQLRRATRQS